MNNLSCAGFFAPFVILRPRRFVAASHRPLSLTSLSAFISFIIKSYVLCRNLSIKPVVTCFKSVDIIENPEFFPSFEIEITIIHNFIIVYDLCVCMCVCVCLRRVLCVCV